VEKVLTIIILFVVQLLAAQPAVEDFKKIFRLEITETDTPVVIDGKLDDKAWTTANVGTDFWQKVPFFAAGADPRTEVMLSYDKDNLYVATKCFQKEDIIIQSLKRDEYWDNDGIAIVLDPLNTRTNGFLFGVSASGQQWDALRSPDDINTDWSNKWYSEVRVEEEFWSMEMAIPFRILRFSPDEKEWGMNFVRNHINENEFHNWTAVPESFWPPDVAFAGALVFDNPPTPKKGNFNLIPFVTGSVNKVAGEEVTLKGSAGLDARLSVSPTLNLDLTFNPDFSQIEVDELVTNLTRFNIFLPEKRTFFLENGDLFSDYGYPAVRPFFSRKIGLDSEQQAVPILFGARLTGNITKSSRLGIMNIHSLKSDNSLAQNQSAVSFQKNFGRSYVRGLFLNRQAFDEFETVDKDYGRNTSIDAAYISDDGKITSWVAINHSFKRAIKGKTGFYTYGIQYQDPLWEIMLASATVQENYFADMGFVQRIENYDAIRDTVLRVGFNDNIAKIAYTIRPKKGKITRHNINLNNVYYTNSDWSFNELLNELNYLIAFRNTAEFELGATRNEIELLFPFSFVSEGEPLPTGRYAFENVSTSFSSDERKMISFGFGGQTGSFYNGKLHRANADVNFRVQPWGNLGFGYQWNNLDFPDPYGNEIITAFLGKLEIGFHKNLLWTTLFQYVDQNEFMGINSRLQWRFAPMSDVFLVFIDNYDVFNGIANRRDVRTNNRALILKVNYWY
jgi:hypothetical protein